MNVIIYKFDTTIHSKHHDTCMLCIAVLLISVFNKALKGINELEATKKNTPCCILD